MPIGCKIVRDFERPAYDLVQRFKHLPVANIADNMGRIAAIDSSIKPIGRGRLLGTAFTIRVPQGDNLMFHAAMDLAKPGDVIVIDAGGYTNRAIFGELMAAYCKSKGIRGIVCDGAVRDRSGLSAMEDFPVYARAANPNGPYKNGPGEINVPVVIGGKLVRPGDIVVGDDDGVVFIDPSAANILADAAIAVEKKEEEILAKILNEGVYERPWVQELLQKLACEII